MKTVTKTKRTRRPIRKPSYCGFVSDGWGLDTNGRMYFQPYSAANDPHIREAELFIADAAADLDAMLADGDIPFLAGKVADDRMELARHTLQKLPRSLLAALWTSRRKIELVPGDIIRHALHGRILGVASFRAAQVAVYGEEFELTLLHEVGHLLDSLQSWHGISSGPAWIEVWKTEKRAGRVSDYANQDLESSEYFAESFALYWASPSSRAKLSAQAKDFMRKLQGAKL